MRVSVIIPVYNASDRIAGAVERILEQHPYEVVLVDDGSSDGSAGEITALAERYENVVALVQPENRGVLRAREAAVHRATGEAVWFVDDDDVWPQTALADLTAAMTDEVDVVVAGARYISTDGRLIRTLAAPAWQGTIDAPAALGMLLDGRLTGHLWNKLFRREVLLRMPYHDSRVHSDLGMVIAAVSRSGRLARTDAVVYDYHPRPGSIIGASTKPRSASLATIDAAMDEALAYAAPALRGGDQHLYFRTRYVWLSMMKDAVQADYRADERARLIAQTRRRLSLRALAALARRRDAKRLALAAAAKTSLAAYRALLSRTSDGRAPRSAQPNPAAAGRDIDVFCVGRGQYANIGDIILRRPLVDWAREAGTAHVYVGGSPDGYDEGLGIQPGDVVYRSYLSWYRAALRSAWRRRAAYLFKPGETQLTLPGLKEHIAVLPLLVALRLRRGRVIRVGSGARNFAPLPRAAMRPSIWLSDLVLWRDRGTADYFGGGYMPDLAFAEGATDGEIRRRRTEGPRDLLVVSMRPDDSSGSRPYPGAAWLDAVKALAEAHDLEIRAVAQVQEDSERAAQLAADLGGEALTWPEVSGHAAQEDRLREVYARTRIAVSDRLHVLITAFTEGAVPIGALTVDSDKIDRHFRAVGVEGLSVVTGGMTAGELKDAFDGILAREDELFHRLRGARRTLADVHDTVQRMLAAVGTGRDARPARELLARLRARGAQRPVVWHLGRTGEIAGGMSQVLNGYLAADFAAADVRVLRTRGDIGDHLASLRHGISAALAILRMKPGDPVAIVAHVSTGGSFLREGSLLRLASLRGIGTIAHIHGSTFAAFAARKQRLVRGVISRADLVVSLSEEITGVCSRMTDPAKVELVPNAVAAGNPGEKTNTVVFGGIVGRRKGVDVLLEAWRELAPDGWELLIAGPVAEPELVADAPAGVRVLGAQPHAKLMELLDRSRVAVLPSRGEALPMFILEAMARDNCVVASDVGAIAEVLSDGCGLVVPAGEPGALRAALQTATGDDHERERIARAGRDRFDRSYSAEAVFPRLERVWLSVVRAPVSLPGEPDETGPAAAGATEPVRAEPGEAEPPRAEPAATEPAAAEPAGETLPPAAAEARGG